MADAGASDVERDSDSSSKGPIIGGVGEQNAPCNPARSPSARTPPQTCVRLCSARAARVPRTVGAVAVVATLVGVGVYCVMKKKNQPPASAGGDLESSELQAQGGVTLSAQEKI